MTDDELRDKHADIVRVLGSIPPGQLGDSAGFHLATARRLLDLLPPADDGEAVTAEWLMSVGIYKYRGEYVADAEVGYDNHTYGICSPNAYGWAVFDSMGGGKASIGCLPTRGHVRRLCAALGIQLMESDRDRQGY